MASHLNTIGMKLRSQAVVVMCRCCTESLQSLQESLEAPHIPAPDPVPSHSLTLYNQTMMWGCGRDVEEEHMVCVHKHMPHWWNQTFQGNWVNRCVGICCRLMSLTNCASLFDFYAICCSVVSILHTCAKPSEKPLKRGGSLRVFVNNSAPCRGPFVSRWSVTLWLSTAAFLS